MGHNDRPHGWLERVPRLLLVVPVHIYRWTLKPFVGWHCRHVPTCSEYALEAISIHGAWSGFWLMVSRLSRCRPGGSAGYDPVPARLADPWWAFWRIGHWRPRDKSAYRVTSVDDAS